MLLQLLANEKRALRHVVSSAFEMLIPHMTQEACDDVLDTVDLPEGEELLGIEGNDDDNDNVEEDDEEADSGDEKDEESDVDEDEAESGDDNVDSGFRDKVKSALGDMDAGMATDLETINVSDIDESRMEELDAALANIFKNTALGAKKVDKAKKTVNQQEVSFRSASTGLLIIMMYKSEHRKEVLESSAITAIRKVSTPFPRNPKLSLSIILTVVPGEAVEYSTFKPRVEIVKLEAYTIF